MIKISKHITYIESIRSEYAIRKGIDNTPDDTQLAAMRMVAVNIFEPVREWVGGPIFVSSFFRNSLVNRGVGGSKKSQHMRGQAIDMDMDIFGGKTNAQVFNWIKKNLDFDQLIWEFGSKTNPAWVHCSYKSPTKNRKSIIIL